VWAETLAGTPVDVQSVVDRRWSSHYGAHEMDETQRSISGPSTAGADVVEGTTRKDRVIAKIVSFLARAVYRDIEVHGEPVPRGSRLTVSNHFGGFSDALVLLHVLPTRPGIVARDVIWRVPVVGRLMNWVGAIPVHKPEDGGAQSNNDQMFASCYKALEDEGHILIFPEGVTRNEPSIARVKTGAARIALGARAHGAGDIEIVPVGIHYEDKAALRSRVFVKGGEPLDLDELVPRDEGALDRGADDRDSVAVVTEAIDVGLRRAAPDFADWDEARLLGTAAEVTLRSQFADPTSAVPIGLRDRLANALADRPAAQRRRICEAAVEYRHDLDALGLTDGELHDRLGSGRFTLSAIWQVLVGVLLAPFALLGAVINIIPFLVVKAVGLLRVAPSMLATIKPVAAFVAFGITWGVLIWRATASTGWVAGAAVLVLLPVYLAAVVWFVERMTLLWNLVRRWRRRSRTESFAEHLVSHREALVEAVLAA